MRIFGYAKHKALIGVLIAPIDMNQIHFYQNTEPL